AARSRVAVSCWAGCVLIVCDVSVATHRTISARAVLDRVTLEARDSVSMEHKAYVFDYDRFHTELGPPPPGRASRWRRAGKPRTTCTSWATTPSPPTMTRPWMSGWATTGKR